MAANKAIVSGISGRYALALFDLANESKALDATESDLAKLDALLAESSEFSQLVESPLLSADQQLTGVAAVADTLDLSDLARKFLGVLATNRRLLSLKAAIADFSKLLAHHKGEVTAEVVSAKALTKTQLTALAKNLKNSIGQDVAINASVDESLLGGLVVKVGSRMVDSSIKTKLDNLKVAMKGVQ